MIKLSVLGRIEVTQKKLFFNWKADNQFLGVKKFKLLALCGEEKEYIKNRVIAELRRKGIIKLDKRNYFVLNPPTEFLQAQEVQNG